MFGFELVGAFVAEGLVQPHGIAKGFDVLEHAEPGGLRIRECVVLGPFVLERSEEPFDDGVWG